MMAVEEKPHLSQYEKVKAITEKLEQGIQDLFESENFKNYLKTLSKFHHYSLGNTILIAMQKPDATLVAGYTSWQRNFERTVMKGAKSIKILAPSPYKKKIEVNKVDPDTGKPLCNSDGSPVKEIQEISVPAFKVVNVFDVSQTEGKALPSIGVNELTGDVAQYDTMLAALEQSCPVSITFEEIQGSAKGYFSSMENRIAVQKDMSQIQTIKTLIHEMAHQKLHSSDEKLARNAKEVEAVAVAYTVSQHFGVETSDYSFAYIAGWSKGKELPELKASLDRIRTAANEMIGNIEDMFQAIQQRKASVHKEPEIKKADPQIEGLRQKHKERECL